RTVGCRINRSLKTARLRRPKFRLRAAGVPALFSSAAVRPRQSPRRDGDSCDPKSPQSNGRGARTFDAPREPPSLAAFDRNPRSGDEGSPREGTTDPAASAGFASTLGGVQGRTREARGRRRPGRHPPPRRRPWPLHPTREDAVAPAEIRLCGVAMTKFREEKVRAARGSHRPTRKPTSLAFTYRSKRFRALARANDNARKRVCATNQSTGKAS
ncbi:hypothetical protein THAOC_04014, partial [Thalassiosira oceanica]